MTVQVEEIFDLHRFFLGDRIMERAESPTYYYTTYNKCARLTPKCGIGNPSCIQVSSLHLLAYRNG